MITPTRNSADLASELHDLLYAIGHDLRAPVRAITGFTSLLQEHLATPDGTASTDSLRFLANIDVAAKRLQVMLDGLLSLSALSQHRPQNKPIALRTLCDTLLAQLPSHRATITMDIDAGALFHADPMLLRVALSALLDNAEKFSRDAERPAISINAHTEADMQVLCVSDNGLGFDMRYVGRLGIPFQTLHARPELTGVGLGLARVRCATRLQGGQWSAEAHLGQGSHFFLRWPA